MASSYGPPTTDSKGKWKASTPEATDEEQYLKWQPQRGLDDARKMFIRVREGTLVSRKRKNGTVVHEVKSEVLRAISLDDERLPFIATAIELTIQFFETPDAKTRLVGVLLLLDEVANGYRAFGTEEDKRQRAGDWYSGIFVESLKKAFPIVYIDEAFNNSCLDEAFTAVAYSAKYHHNAMEVYLSGALVGKIKTIIAKGDMKEIRNYITTIVIILIHEVGGHLMLADLTRGTRDTPPSMAAIIPLSNKGESGHKVERVVFGGLVYNIADAQEPWRMGTLVVMKPRRRNNQEVYEDVLSDDPDKERDKDKIVNRETLFPLEMQERILSRSEFLQATTCLFTSSNRKI